MRKLSLIGISAAVVLGAGSFAAFAQSTTDPETPTPSAISSTLTRDGAQALLALGEEQLVHLGVTAAQIAVIKEVAVNGPLVAPGPVAARTSAEPPTSSLTRGQAQSLLALSEARLTFYGVTPEQIAVIKEAAVNGPIEALPAPAAARTSPPEAPPPYRLTQERALSMLALGEARLLYYGVTPEQLSFIKQTAAAPAS